MSRSTVGSAGSVDALLDGFVVQLREQRGVSALTIDVYVRDVRRFLTAYGGVDKLRELTAAEVSRVCWVRRQPAGRRRR